MSRHRSPLAILCLAATACGMFGGGGSGTASAPPPPPPFTDKVWRVAEAPDIPLGTLYVFLSDNTMLVTPAAGLPPALGRWHHAGGGLVLIEAGYRYPADILEIGAEVLSIRLHRPNGTADVRMVAAR